MVGCFEEATNDGFSFGRKLGGGRFLALITVKVFSSLFFARDIGSYGQNSQTQHMFDSLTGSIIAFGLTNIYHCLKEYNENITKTTITSESADHVEYELFLAFS